MKRTLRDRVRILPWVGHVILAAGLLASVAVAQVSVIGGSTAPLSCDGTNCTMASGQVLVPDGTPSLPAIAFSSDPDHGFRRVGGGTTRTFAIASDGFDRIRFGDAELGVHSGGRVVWYNTTALGDGAATADLGLSRGGTNGSARLHLGTTPTVSGCGSGASISGNNSLGTVVIGTTPGPCVVTFSGTWTNIPKCTLNNRTSAQLARATANSTTTFTIAGTLTASDEIDYLCLSS